MEKEDVTEEEYQLSLLRNLKVWFGNSSSELFHVITEKKSIVANIRNRIGT